MDSSADLTSTSAVQAGAQRTKRKSPSSDEHPSSTKSTSDGIARPIDGVARSADGHPTVKRARKAINCEPCRVIKVKCDRYVGHASAME
jgi:hypothetical protein